jgi:hypothetical protein
MDKNSINFDPDFINKHIELLNAVQSIFEHIQSVTNPNKDMSKLTYVEQCYLTVLNDIFNSIESIKPEFDSSLEHFIAISSKNKQS